MSKRRHKYISNHAAFFLLLKKELTFKKVNCMQLYSAIPPTGFFFCVFSKDNVLLSGFCVWY